MGKNIFNILKKDVVLIVNAEKIDDIYSCFVIKSEALNVERIGQGKINAYIYCETNGEQKIYASNLNAKTYAQRLEDCSPFLRL